MEKTTEAHPADRFVVITGCSAGGKSTLLAELRRRGHATIEEAGRQVVRDQMALDEDGLPWKNVERFAELCIERNMAAYQRSVGLTFFDRSLLDNICALERLGLSLPEHHALLEQYRYASHVFFAPPWPEIFQMDAERKHGFDEAVEEVEALRPFYTDHRYRLIDLPLSSVAERADFIEDRIEWLL